MKRRTMLTAMLALSAGFKTGTAPAAPRSDTSASPPTRTQPPVAPLDPPPALTATPSPAPIAVMDGRFVRAGRPIRAIGINYFDAFIRMTGTEGKTAQPGNKTWKTGFAVLRDHGIPFLRFNAGGFWPADWALYRTDKARYFGLLDELVSEAERLDLGLIPSLFWNYSTPPDLVGEPLGEWGNPSSATHAFMRTYIDEVVGRFRASPAIWGWEFGNEYMLAADLPDPEMGRGKAVPRLGTPAERTARDKLFRPAILTAYREFGRAVRRLDPLRPLFTGDSLPRTAAWHNRHENNWTPDSHEQWTQMLLADNPDPIDTLSGHLYWPETDGRQHNGPAGLDPAAIIAFCAAAGRRAAKPFFLGEFGPAPEAPAHSEARRGQFAALLAAIEQAEVGLAALWNFDYPRQPLMTITADNHNAFMLKALGEANARLGRDET